MIRDHQKECNPLVTVYITCCNYGKFLEKAVWSVVDQIYPNWELFVIDDGSSDQTSLIIKKLSGLLRGRNVDFITNKKPKGLQKTANEILSLAQGDYIIRLDADDWLDEAALLVMVAKITSEKKLSLVYSNYFYVDENEKVISIERQRKLWEEDKSGLNPPHGACTLVSVRALKHAGGYSEEIEAQDGWEIWFKLVDRVQSASIETPLFYYRQHNNSLSQNRNRILKARNKIFEKLNSNDLGSYKVRNICVLPVQESYPGLERVPFFKLGDNYLIDVVIKNALRSEIFETIVVATESQDVINYLNEKIKTQQIKNVICYKRQPTELTGYVPLSDIVLSAVEFLEETIGTRADIVSFISLHAPLRSAETIKNAHNVLMVTNSDTVVSVIEEREPIFGQSEHGLTLLSTGKFDHWPMARDKMFRFNGGIISVWHSVLKDKKRLWGEKISYLEVSHPEEVQINRANDLDDIIKHLN